MYVYQCELNDKLDMYILGILFKMNSEVYNILQWRLGFLFMFYNWAKQSKITYIKPTDSFMNLSYMKTSVL